MSDLSLTQQLAERTKTFIARSGLTQKELAKLLKVDKGNFSKFLSGQVGLNSDTTLQLVRLMNLSPRSLQLKFGQPEQTRARLLHLQENGKQMRLSNDGWVSGQSGTDPNDTTGIDATPSARDTDGSSDYLDKIIPFLKQQQEIYREAIGHIDDYLANVQRVKINRQGPSEAPRRISDSDASSHPGSRGDLLSAAKLKEQLEFVRRERKKSEEQLELQAELDRERKLYWDARIKTLRKQEGQ
jgi:plasmid maintenance system antidote protein VapI